MAGAIKDQRYEPAFFQALLITTVYAHIPLPNLVDVDSDRIRFIQFHRPGNGLLVLPFFTDEAKAHFATQSAV